MNSLRLRLLIGAVTGIAIALSLAGVALVGFFESHVRQRYVKELDDHLLQLVAMIETGADGGLRLKQELSEPEFRRPLSGSYWQVGPASGQPGLRSRSLWDETLMLAAPAAERGERRVYDTGGPGGRRLLVVERLIELPLPSAPVLRFSVAGESRIVDDARRDFAGVVWASLLALGLLLAAASWFQVGAGLAPLRSLRSRLDEMRKGAAARVEGRFPVEVVGLVDDLNRLIETQEAEAERGRKNAAKLGHGLKTPLAVLAAEARGLRERGEATAADAVENEIAAMDGQVARALASARAVGPRAAIGTRTDLRPVIDRLLSVMRKLPGGAALDWQVVLPQQLSPIRIDRRDLEDILGNVVDNARKWAKRTVRISARLEGGDVVVAIEDDGPGIPAGQTGDVLAGGVRLDRSVPGSGVGLSIVKDLTELHGGSVRLQPGKGGAGLCVIVTLEAATPPPS